VSWSGRFAIALFYFIWVLFRNPISHLPLNSLPDAEYNGLFIQEASMNRRRKVVSILGVLIAGFVLLQLIPIGSINPDFAFAGNPPVVQNVQWDSAQTEAIVRRACYDCHSNETGWPFYSRIAPVSWLVSYDVHGGRDEMNFSDLGRTDDLAEDIEEVLEKGEMPLPMYLIMHPEANLSSADKQALIEGVRNTFGRDD
jgi:hypothetical protein